MPGAEALSPAELLALQRPSTALRIIGHLTFGYNRELFQFYSGLGSTAIQRWRNFVDYQLDWAAIDDSAMQ